MKKLLMAAVAVATLGSAHATPASLFDDENAKLNPRGWTFLSAGNWETPHRAQDFYTTKDSNDGRVKRRKLFRSSLSPDGPATQAYAWEWRVTDNQGTQHGGLIVEDIRYIGNGTGPRDAAIAAAVAADGNVTQNGNGTTGTPYRSIQAGKAMPSWSTPSKTEPNSYCINADDEYFEGSVCGLDSKPYSYHHPDFTLVWVPGANNWEVFLTTGTHAVTTLPGSVTNTSGPEDILRSLHKENNGLALYPGYDVRIDNHSNTAHNTMWRYTGGDIDQDYNFRRPFN